MNEEVKMNLPLDTPRSITLKAKDHSYLYSLRRVTAEDWTKYYRGIVHQIIQQEGGREQVFEADSAVIELVNDVLVSVDGYGDLGGLKDWRAALPIKHRVAVGIMLRSVATQKEKSDEPVLCDLVEVKLNAAWGIDGHLAQFTGLVHRFRHPQPEHLKKFNFEAARVRVKGNSSEGISIYPSRQAIAMKLYDELIESVDGYSVAGQPLTDIEAIKQEMDGAHKAAAALELFLGEDEVTVVE
jgi:hypothetical protein